MKKNLFFTLVTACFPGFGQMYYGYMRRGTSLALWFWGLVFFASLSGLGMLGILLPVIWAYSFFDTFNIRSLSPEQYAAFGDDYIPNRKWAEQVHLDRIFGGGKGKIVGWVLIIFGCLIIYNTLFANLLWRLYDYVPFLAYFIEAIPPLFVAGVVILLGLSVLKGKKPGFMSRKDDDYNQDDYSYGDWKNNQPSPPPEYYSQNQTGPWDARQNPGPQPTWDFSQNNSAAAAATQPQPAAPVQNATAAAAAQPEPPTAPMPEVDKEIVLSFEESITEITSDAKAEDSAPETEEKPDAEEAKDEDTDKKTSRKGKKKDKADEASKEDEDNA